MSEDKRTERIEGIFYQNFKETSIPRFLILRIMREVMSFPFVKEVSICTDYRALENEKSAYYQVGKIWTIHKTSSPQILWITWW